MPLYNYECKKCDFAFEDVFHIEDRKIPCSKACPSCKKRKCVEQVLYPVMIGDAVRLGVTKPNPDFQEVLAKIHSKTPGSKLNQKLSQYVKPKRSL